MRRKSRDKSEFDQEEQDKKLIMVLVGFVVLMVVLGLFMWWLKQFL